MDWNEAIQKMGKDQAEKRAVSRRRETAGSVSKGSIDLMNDGLSCVFRCNADMEADTCDPRVVPAMSESKFIEVVSKLLEQNSDITCGGAE